MEEDTPMKLGLIENHLQTILTGLLLAGVIWIASSVNGLQQSVAVLEVQVKATNEKITQGTQNRFDSNDAAAQLEIRDLKIDRLEDRVDRLEDSN